MKNNRYWIRRMEILESAQLQKGQRYYADLERQYRIASTNIEREINNWYQRVAGNNQISMADARKLLTTSELSEFKWTVQEYIKYGERNAINQLWMKQLENASARVHISRLEALKLQMQQQVEVLYGYQFDGFDKLMKKIYSDGYYHTAFEIQKGFNIGWDLHSLNSNQLDKILSKPWAVDGKNFSDRLWGNKSKLVNELHTELTQMVITGSSPDGAISNISKKLNTSKKNSGRLVMTESAAFASAAQKDAFNDLDVERYEIVSTLDSSTSEICQTLDGEVFDMKDYQVGVTAPPFHPWCRTTTVPYFDDNYGERAARDEETGQTYYVPSNMKYKDWKESFVDGGGSKTGLKSTDGNGVIGNSLFPKEIAGVICGKIMTRDEANHGKPNPNFAQSPGYRVNCQSCVITYEARLRGYDVQTLPNVKGSKLAELSRQTNMAWIDPSTGTHPAYIYDETATTVKKLQTFIENTVEQYKRYTLEFSWKGRSRTGHIISMDRDELGALRLYDPQTGKTYTDKQITTYLGQLKYKMSIGGMKVSTPPKILRVDDKLFNLDVVNQIMEGVTK